MVFCQVYEIYEAAGKISKHVGSKLYCKQLTLLEVLYHSDASIIWKKLNILIFVQDESWEKNFWIDI